MWVAGNLSSASFSSFLILFYFSFLMQLVHMNAAQFLDWGKPCKRAKPNEFLRPTEECDQGRGLLCQKYTQGEYCGCEIGGALTFDRKSKECRRKSTAFCYYENASEELLSKLPFNQKCHEWAECIKVNSSAYTGSKKSEDIHLCQCKEGYLTAADLGECIDPTAIGSGHRLSFHYPFLLLLILPFSLLLFRLV